MEALGLIETKGLTGAIVAADTALKAANVTLLNAEVIKGGYVTVQLSGDVAAVKAAVDAGSEAVGVFGTLISAHVIPRMDMGTSRLIKNVQPAEELLEQPTEDERNVEAEQEESTAQTEQVKEAQENQEKTIEVESAEKSVVYKKKGLEKMTVNQLRTLVRKTNVMNEQPEKINTSKKAELIQYLLRAKESY